MEKENLSLKERGDIRRLHKKLRGEMSAEEVSTKSRSICEKLLSAPWYQSCEMIYGYYPLGKEVDCLDFLEQALADGKRVALPRMLTEVTGSAQESKDTCATDMAGAEVCRMDFYEITSLTQVAEGGFHVMEPIDVCPLVELEDAVVLVPGVVFDQSGNRYGYGKGYYDRYFARFPKLQRIALAYENQMEQQLEVLATDIKMDYICTEEQIYYVTTRKDRSGIWN